MKRVLINSLELLLKKATVNGYCLRHIGSASVSGFSESWNDLCFTINCKLIIFEKVDIVFEYIIFMTHGLFDSHLLYLK